jgi:hypothetical protein
MLAAGRSVRELTLKCELLKSSESVSSEELVPQAVVPTYPNPTAAKSCEIFCEDVSLRHL